MIKSTRNEKKEVNARCAIALPFHVTKKQKAHSEFFCIVDRYIETYIVSCDFLQHTVKFEIVDNVNRSRNWHFMKEGICGIFMNRKECVKRILRR